MIRPDDEQLARIAAKLQALAEVPANLESFGAHKHRFVLNPPLPESDVTAFEQAHGVQLPEAYRRFITSFADGGAGPTYGVLPLADAYEAVSDSYPGHVSAPSPFERGLTYGDDWWDDFADEELRRDPCQGAIAVVHHGCTSYTLLIVSGPARGRLVSIDYNGVPAPYMLEDPDFLAWYERWLDELAAGYDVTRIFEKIPGDEDELLAIATTDIDHDRRVRATWSLCALPLLSAPGRIALTELIADPVATVRTAALGIAQHFRATETEGSARVALEDRDPVVRAAAMRSLRALKPADLAAIARRMLRDSDKEVVLRAVWSLQDLDETSGARSATVVSSSDPEVRVTGIHYLRDAAGDGAADLLTAALDDREARVRWTAVQTIEHRKMHELQPKLADLLKTEIDPTVLVNLRRAAPALR